MRKAGARIGLALVGLLGVIAIGLAVWEPLLATRAEAPPPHRYDTRIVRDSYGVPHIFGTSEIGRASCRERV